MTTSYLLTTERAITTDLLRQVEFNRHKITPELISHKIAKEHSKVMTSGAPTHIKKHLVNLLNIIELRLKEKYHS